MKFISIILLAFLFNNTPKKYDNCLQLDIVLLGDYSGSMAGHEKEITQAFNEFIDQLPLSETSIKMGLITFANKGTLITNLTSDKDQIKNDINGLNQIQAGGSTNMADGLYLAFNELISNGRKDYKKMVIVVSDGAPMNPEKTMTVINQLKLSNVGVCGIFIRSYMGDPQFMKSITSDFCYVESDYENLIVALKNLDICI